MNRKFIAIIICVLACTTAGAYDFKVWDVCFKLVNQREVSVTAGDEPYSGFVNIPDSIVADGKTYRVTAIADRAFNVCSNLTSLRLPTGLRTIGNAAFSACTSLGYVNMPEGVESIGEAAFYGCSALITMRIPASVKLIGNEAFARCTRLERFIVDEQNSHYAAPDGVLYNKTVTTLVAYPNAKGSTYSLPATVGEIGPWAFMGCTKVERLVMSNALTTIGDAAFLGCSALSHIELPESLTSIGRWAFAECAALRRTTIPASVSTIGDDAFSFCDSLENIFVSNDNSHFTSDNGVLLNKERTKVVCCPGAKNGSYQLPNSVTAIDDHAFYGSHALQEVVIPAGTTLINNNPFVFCDSLEKILVDDANSSFSSVDGTLLNKERTAILAFPNGRTGDYAVPQTVTAIGSEPFMMSKRLTRLALPATLTTIGDYTFLGCEELTTVNIPPSVETIGNGAFADCTELERIICTGAPIVNTAFADESYEKAHVIVPGGWSTTYMGSRGWSRFQQVESYGFYLPKQTLLTGGRQTLPVMTYDEMPLTSMTTIITLPEGMRIPNGDNGQPMVSAPTELAGTYAIDCQTADNSYRLTVTAADGTTLPTGGTLCLLTLDIDGNSPTGMRDILLSDSKIGYDDGFLNGEAMQKDQACHFFVADGTTGILQIEAEKAINWPADVYNMQGMMVRENTYDLKGLPSGIYIVNGHKVVVK